MQIHVITLFPELVSAVLTSVVGRAAAEGRFSVELCDLRPFGLGKHQNVDDTPYGGGSGMLMRVEPLVHAMEAIDARMLEHQARRPRRVLLTPQGQRLTQRHVTRLVGQSPLTLICGRYEGFDERVRYFVDEEISLGDFVMTGGEIAAMALIDAMTRLVPGVLGNEHSSVSESHGEAMAGQLEYAQYTRPVTFRGYTVPEVLRGGDHRAIAAWRAEDSARRTHERRPELAGASK